MNPRSRKARVLRVTDGHTFQTHSGDNVRLADVEAPVRGTEEGRQAANILRTLIEDKDVSISDLARSFDRVIAEVSVGGISVNQVMRSHLAGLT